MKIIPYTGYGTLLLGSSRRYVVGELGEPDSKDCQAQEDGTEIEYYEYAAAGLSLGFASELGDRLSVMTIRSPDATYDDGAIIGEEIKTLMARHPEIVLDEDLGPGGQEYLDEASDLSFWVLDGLVDSVTIFPDWIDDATPRWP